MKWKVSKSLQETAFGSCPEEQQLLQLPGETFLETLTVLSVLTTEAAFQPTGEKETLHRGSGVSHLGGRRQWRRLLGPQVPVVIIAAAGWSWRIQFCQFRGKLVFLRN